jgi:hypothetical protein
MLPNIEIRFEVCPAVRRRLKKDLLEVPFDGSCEICMIDNTHVVVLQAAGSNGTSFPALGCEQKL